MYLIEIELQRKTLLRIYKTSLVQSTKIGLLRWSVDVIEDFLVHDMFCNVIRHVVLVHD